MMSLDRPISRTGDAVYRLTGAGLQAQPISTAIPKMPRFLKDTYRG